jgi:hypothetical protein
MTSTVSCTLQIMRSSEILMEVIFKIVVLWVVLFFLFLDVMIVMITLFVTSVTVRPSRNTAVTLFHKDEIPMEGGKLPGP